MKTLSALAFAFFACGIAAHAQTPSAPLRLGIIGLVHGHAGGFLGGSALVPAGAALKRSDVQIVGIAEPDRKLFDHYAQRLHLDPKLYFSTTDQMLSQARPQAVLVFTSTFGHTQAVEECARHGIHVMMEKPLAVSYKDALAMADAAQKGHIHVLVDYETTWYASNTAAHDLLEKGALGDARKIVAHDGHSGPIHMQPEFVQWLTDPKLNGAGALYDFGCYGADLATWLMKGQAPRTVTAVTKRIQPEYYPKVDDEADVILTYPSAVALIEGSWNWPFDIKDLEVYGKTGYVKTIRANQVNVRRQHEQASHIDSPQRLEAPYDDPLHYLEAVLNGKIEEDGSLSSLKTNVIVSEILDAARQSAKSGKTISLPLGQ
jgi:glucose-fructose oxidoreductase